MKKLTTPLLAVFLALSTRLLAAEPESSFGLAPSGAPQVPPSSSLPLIPDTLQPAEKHPKDEEQPRTDKTAQAEDLLAKRIRLRRAKVKAERDPGLQAIRAKGLAAPTDFEQRKYYIEYFNGICDLMAKFDPTLKKEDIDELKNRYAGRFVQSRIAPTIDPATFKK